MTWINAVDWGLFDRVGVGDALITVLKVRRRREEEEEEEEGGRRRMKTRRRYRSCRE